MRCYPEYEMPSSIGVRTPTWPPVKMIQIAIGAKFAPLRLTRRQNYPPMCGLIR